MNGKKIVVMIKNCQMQKFFFNHFYDFFLITFPFYLQIFLVHISAMDFQEQRHCPVLSAKIPRPKLKKFVKFCVWFSDGLFHTKASEEKKNSTKRQWRSSEHFDPPPLSNWRPFLAAGLVYRPIGGDRTRWSGLFSCSLAGQIDLTMLLFSHTKKMAFSDSLTSNFFFPHWSFWSLVVVAAGLETVIN
jgi:hypothetical protein